MRPTNSERVQSMHEALSVFFASGGTLLILFSMVALVLVLQMYCHWTVRDALLVALAFLFWSVPEWCIHRYLMHKGSISLLPVRWNVFYQVHMAHHREPGNISNALLKPLSILVGGMGVALLLGLLSLSPKLSMMGTLAFLLVALNYNFVHFLCHTSVETRIPLLRQALVNHRLHHEGVRGGYCLSNIWMDYFMGSILKNK